MTIVIFSGKAFDGKGFHDDARLKVDCDHGSILEFGERGSIEEPRGAKRIGVEGGTFMPGLIDAHVHFYSSDGAGVNEWASVPDALAVLRGTRDLRKLLRAGFTAVRELGTKGGVHLAQAVAEGSIEGPEVVSCARALAQTGGDDDPPKFPLAIAQELASYTYFCDGPWECRRAVRMVARDGGRVVKFYASGAFSRGTKVRSNFTEEETRAMVDESKRLGLKVAAHAYGEEAIGRSVRCGVDSIEHGLGLTPRLASEMKRRGVYYVPTLFTYANPSYKNKYNEMVKRHLSEDMLIAKEAGVGVVMGSDIVGDGARPHGRNFEEITAEAKFLGNREALVAATSRAAECLGLEKAGALREGYRADVVVTKGDLEKDIQALAPEKIVHVMKLGKLI